MREAQVAVDQGRQITRLTVGDYLADWLDTRRSLRPSTLKSYREHVTLYLMPLLGEIRLSELRAHHVDSMLAAISTPQRRRPLSPSTVRRVHATLRTALNSAVRQRLLPYNPAVHVDLPVQRREPVTVWGPEEVARFLAATEDDRLHPLYRLVVMTGMRRGEVVGLRWADIDFERGLVAVNQQVVQLGPELRIGPPKTRAGTRVVPVDLRTLDVLKEHQRRQTAEAAAWGPARPATGLVFTREDGSLVRPETVSRHFRLLSRRAGLPLIRFHDLRHTSASLALTAGVAMRVVSDRLGHTTTSITADLYTHVSPVVSRRAATAIADLVGAAGEQPVSES
jgi:integrase